MSPDPSHDASRAAAAIAVATLRARWLSNPPPTIRESIAPETLADEHVLAEVIAADASERRLRDLPSGLDTYLSERPEITHCAAACRAVLMAELVSRAGEGIDLVSRELLARLPDHAGAISAVVELARAFQDAVDNAPPPRAPGDVVGKYLLHAKLGEGSFGETWQAWDNLLQRFVALKILHAAHLAGERGSRAFLQEARAAAALDHESIVRIHEAGRLPITGEYFLDAQLIGPPLEKGQAPDPTRLCRTLDDALARGPMSPLRAARLIAQASRAVAHAHARGITHRDLKPSNILISEDNKPMVADFGLSISTSTLANGPDQRPARRITGTPAYLAPELAKGQPATPLSDIYALGATLRALLLGRHPIEPDKSSTIDPIEQVVTRLRHEPLPSITSQRGDLPRALAAICDRATAHNPRDRYPSADSLAADLDAFLSHRPTKALPAGPLARGSLWLRRNRLGASITLALAILITGLTAAFIQRLALERDRALAAQHDADLQRDAALEVRDTMLTTNQFIARAFNSARGQESDPNFTAVKVLELAGQRVGRTFADRPAVEASVRLFLGQAALGAGGFDLARDQLDRALTLRTELFGPDHPETLAVVRVQADLCEVLSQREQAESLFRRVLEGLHEPEGSESPDTLRALVFLAGATAKRGDRPEGIRMAERADRGYTRLNYKVGADHQAALNLLVLFFNATQEFDKALATQQRIVDLNSANLGADDISTLNARQALGWIHRLAGQNRQAAEVYRACLDRYLSTVGPSHPMSMHVGIELAMSELTDDPADARKVLEPILAAAPTLSPASPIPIRAFIASGRIEEFLKNDDGAKAAFQTAYDLALKHRGPSHAVTHDAANLYARVLERLGATAEATKVRTSLKPIPPK